MQVGPRAWGSSRHEASALCRTLVAQKEQHACAAASVAALECDFTAYGRKLSRVEHFKYLGRILAMDDGDVPAMRQNLKRARAQWGRLQKVLAKEGVPGPVAGMFYQAVVAAVLLYGSETWVLPPSALQALDGFHVEAARRLTGMRPKKIGELWIYPKSSSVLAAARLHPIAYYITKRRQTVLKAIEGRPILDACREAERRRGSPSRQYWWEQNFSLAGYEPEWEKNSHLAEASGPLPADAGEGVAGEATDSAGEEAQQAPLTGQQLDEPRAAAALG
jgi:hypothetical protein